MLESTPVIYWNPVYDESGRVYRVGEMPSLPLPIRGPPPASSVPFDMTVDPIMDTVPEVPKDISRRCGPIVPSINSGLGAHGKERLPRPHIFPKSDLAS